MKRWIARNKLALICSSIILVAVTVCVVVMASGAGSSRTQPAPGSSAANEHDHDDEEDEHVHDDELEGLDISCQTNLSPEEYSAFLVLAMRYEEAYQTPPSNERNEILSGLTTAEYQTGHETIVDEGSDTIVTILWEDTATVTTETALTCDVNDDGTRTIGVRATIQTSYIDESGTEVIIFDKITLHDTHYSEWVLSDGAWKVNREY